MLTQIKAAVYRHSLFTIQSLFAPVLVFAMLGLAGRLEASSPGSFQEKLKELPFKIAYECYTDDNWEIFVRNADGSGVVNLTQTPNEQEHYPQVSPDGSEICFSVDEGEGRQAVRSLYVMDIDGKNRKKLVDHAR